jgi:hypothetical protein
VAQAVRKVGSRRVAFTLALGLAPAAAACGPSFQAIYEGDQRFEHCYALDDNPTASLDDKGKCWRDWMQNSTYGQTRDRVEYAAVRQRALSRLAIPTDEAMMQAAPGQVVSRSVATPAPTSAFAPPPKTMGDADPHAPGPTATSLPQAPPGRVVFVAPAPAPTMANGSAAPPSAACQDGCTHTWEVCGGKSDKPDPACAKTYKTCMRGCFK